MACCCCRTTCALTVVAAAVAASIPAQAAKITHDVPAACDGSSSHQHAPGGPEDSDSDCRAWLLGDEEDATCRVCKGRHCGKQADGCGARQHPEVPDTAACRDSRRCQQRCVLVVVDSPASDSESVTSDQLQHREQQLHGHGQQEQQQQPPHAAWYARQGDAVTGSNSSRGTLRQPLLPPGSSTC